MNGKIPQKSKSPFKSSPSQDSQNSSSDSELEGKVKPENDALMEGAYANSQEQLAASTSTASTGNTAQNTGPGEIPFQW